MPTGLLVDADGVIRWRGHPATIDVEAEIDALLAGDGDPRRRSAASRLLPGFF